MIKALLIDDEEHCLHTLQQMLETNCADVELLALCRTGAEGLHAIKTLKPDLVFLDVEMPCMNGFDLLQQFSDPEFKIVFTTSYDQYAIRAFRFSALDYLLKPVEARELIAAVEKARQLKKPAAEQFEMLMKQFQGKERGFSKIALPTPDGYELIKAEEVIYCQADDNYTHYFLKNKQKLTSCRSLKETEEQLQVFSFFLRVHHSFIVNLNEIKKYVRGDGGYLIMSNDCSVSVSRSRKEKLLQLF